MPTFIELVNIVIPKDIINEKYKGGIDAFRKWFVEKNGKRRQEDNELFAVARMNSCDDVIEYLTANGLNFDYENKRSDDFACVYRYGGAVWEVEWLRYNATYIWHKNCDKDKIAQAERINKMDMDVIADAIDRGEDIWETIW